MQKIDHKEDNRIEKISKLFTVKKFAQKNREQGTWPSSESAIWAIRASSPENGFEDVFITVGRRVLINEEKFWGAIERQQKGEKNGRV